MSDLKAPVFHIIHGSFVDGYGVRTTVFLKGCPLRCVWCCNPEGQNALPELKVSPARCTGCGRCVPECPVVSIEAMPKAGNLRIDRSVCNNCGRCVEVCHTGALEMFGGYMTVEEVFEIVKRDEAFYRTSGGGVTIGGGEATCHPEFTLQLLQRCRSAYIHTALDTCGHVATPTGIKALEEADLVLYDLKCLDPETHRSLTGVSNELILANLRRLDGMGKAIIVRVPLIPGRTDSEESLSTMATFLMQLKSVQRIDLLPFHRLGKVKYEQLGREDYLECEPISAERQLAIMELFQRHGLNVQLGG
jgi:pyruvate formate lyase activating enzyme